MALSILDGNQSATTLSTILSSGQHITAHTVVSLGTQAITDMRGAVSGSVVSISNLPSTQTIAGTVTAVLSGTSYVEIAGGIQNYVFDYTSFPVSGTVTANPTGTQTIAGTVTANLAQEIISTNDDVGSSAPRLVVGVFDALGSQFGDNKPFPISGTVTASLSAGTNRIGVVTIGGGTVTIGAGTAQIGSVTVGNSVTIGSLPALAAGTANIGVVTIGNIRRAGDGTLTQLTTEVGSGALQTVIGSGTAIIGSVTASISNSVTIASLPAISGTVTANTFALQGTAVTTSNFTSTTASTVLANYNATREVLTIFNEGAGNLFVCPGATCTTVQYQIRLSSGDYYEVPNHQTTITHSAVFATAGTARVTQLS